MFALSDPLVRFVTDGLMATIDSYLAGSLPLHRFAWELSARVDVLASLDAPSRALTRLRWLLRTVDLVHVAQSARAVTARTSGFTSDLTTDLSRDEQNTLTVALDDFRAVLATLVSHNPLDPAAHPSVRFGRTPALRGWNSDMRMRCAYVEVVLGGAGVFRGTQSADGPRS